MNPFSYIFFNKETGCSTSINHQICLLLTICLAIKMIDKEKSLFNTLITVSI